MNEPLEILLTESHHGVGAHAQRALEERGHHVHRCYPAESEGFPCVALSDPQNCPNNGNLDVVLAVRRGVVPHPTALESGVSCAIRAGVILAEHGTDVLDPFAPWVARRVSDDDIVGACEDAAVEDLPTTLEVKSALLPLLERAGMESGDVSCSVTHQHGRRTVVHLYAGAADRRLAQALAVRAHDALRTAPRPARVIDVEVLHGVPADHRAAVARRA